MLTLFQWRDMEVPMLRDEVVEFDLLRDGVIVVPRFVISVAVCSRAPIGDRLPGVPKRDRGG